MIAHGQGNSPNLRTSQMEWTQVATVASSPSQICRFPQQRLKAAHLPWYKVPLYHEWNASCFLTNPPTSTVTEGGVRLLAAQKPLKRPGWWKGKFALFWMLATRRAGGEGRRLSKGQLPSTTGQSVGKSFYRWREGATCRNSTVSSDSHLGIGHRWSDQRHLDCFKYN